MFRLVGRSQAAPLADTLHRYAEHCDVLQARLLELDQLRATVITGVTSGAMAISGPPETAAAGPPEPEESTTTDDVEQHPALAASDQFAGPEQFTGPEQSAEPDQKE